MNKQTSTNFRLATHTEPFRRINRPVQGCMPAMSALLFQLGIHHGDQAIDLSSTLITIVLGQVPESNTVHICCQQKLTIIITNTSKAYRDLKTCNAGPGCHGHAIAIAGTFVCTPKARQQNTPAKQLHLRATG